MTPLPLRCEAFYEDGFLQPENCGIIFNHLIAMGIEHSKLVPSLNFGKLMMMDDDLYDQGVFDEYIWGKTSRWAVGLDKVRTRLEQLLNWRFHTCVAIYYPDGNSGVDFHSDLAAFGDTSVLASISLGEERLFELKEIATGKVFSQRLAAGSLIVMGHGCQELYEHRVPIEPDRLRPRINLTFRRYGY